MSLSKHPCRTFAQQRLYTVAAWSRRRKSACTCLPTCAFMLMFMLAPVVCARASTSASAFAAVLSICLQCRISTGNTRLKGVQPSCRAHAATCFAPCPHQQSQLHTSQYIRTSSLVALAIRAAVNHAFIAHCTRPSASSQRHSDGAAIATARSCDVDRCPLIKVGKCAHRRA